MPGALFSRIKVWVSGEDVVYSDLNAEFDNILNNLFPAGMDDYSVTVTQMRSTVDPGEVGSESQATSLAGEIERIRYVIKEMKGDVAQWYVSSGTSLSEIEDALGTTLNPNRLSSGLTRADSEQPVFIVPNGAAASANIDATPTPLVYYVNGTAVTVSADVAVTNISVAPGSNNTALVNDGTANDAEGTKLFGEYGSSLLIDNAGTEIVSMVGKLAGFKINNGITDEYFIARVKSSTELTDVRRGYFFNSSSSPVPRIAIADNDAITLLRITWLFGKSDGSVVKVTNEPTWQADTPTSPVTDDYWYDLENNTWKRYDGGSFVSADATLLGIVVCDSSNCIGARSLEFDGATSGENGIELEKNSAIQILGVRNNPAVQVHTSKINYAYDAPVWDISTDLESGLTEQNSTMYYLYLGQTGDEWISDKAPYDRTGDLKGYYHPHHVWRCVGQVYNDSSGDLESPQPFMGLKVIPPAEDSKIVTITSSDSAYTVKEKDETILIDAVSGDVTVNMPRAASHKGRKLIFKRIDNQYHTVPTFADGNVTVGTESIAITAHGLASLEKVRLSNSGGALPAGLASATDYWVIYVDANTIKLASSLANAKAGTAVDITAAAGGGTHTVTVQARTVTLDGYSTDTLNDAATLILYTKGEIYGVQSLGTTDWTVTERNARTAWASFTLVATSLGTLANINTTWRREGTDLLISGTFNVGTVAGSDAFFTLPFSLVMDTTGLTTYAIFGEIHRANATDLYETGMNGLFYDGSNTDKLYIAHASASDTTLDLSNGSQVFGTAGELGIFKYARVPISGWKA